MTENREVKFQQRLDSQSDKDLIEFATEAAVNSGAVGSKKDALVYIAQKFLEIESPESSLTYRFSGEINELKQNAENITRLFSEIIDKTEREITTATNKANSKNESLLLHAQEQDIQILSHQQTLKELELKHQQELEMLKKECQEQLAAKELELTDLKSEKEELEKAKHTLTVSIEVLQNEKEEMQDDNKSLNTQITSKENMYTALHQDKNNLQDQLKFITAKMDEENESHKQELASTIVKFEGKIAAAESKAEKLQNELTDSLKEIIMHQQNAITPALADEKVPKDKSKKDTK